MAAHFVAHVYTGSHDTYSFGVIHEGTQAFRCRGAYDASDRRWRDVSLDAYAGRWFALVPAAPVHGPDRQECAR